MKGGNDDPKKKTEKCTRHSVVFFLLKKKTWGEYLIGSLDGEWTQASIACGPVQVSSKVHL